VSDDEEDELEEMPEVVIPDSDEVVLFDQFGRPVIRRRKIGFVWSADE